MLLHLDPRLSRVVIHGGGGPFMSTWAIPGTCFDGGPYWRVQFQAKTVLVAEDEALIRMMVADVLVEAGFVVIEASYAAEALTILQAQSNQIHLLFTDIHMPGPMNGLQLAHHVRGHWPWIGLLIASGAYSPTAADLPVGSRFLRKLYDPAHVVAHAHTLTAF